MDLPGYINTMNTSVVLFIFGSMLTIIGFLINNSIRDLKDKFDELKQYHKDHDTRIDLQEHRRIKLEREISDKRHHLMTEVITPLIFRVSKIEDRLNHIGE